MGGILVIVGCIAFFLLIEYLDQQDDADDEKFWSDEDNVP